jgi:hypothetical protein
MQRAITLLPLLLAATSFAQKVVIEYDHDVDFTAYRTYDWKDHPFLTNHPESKQFTVGIDLVRSNVNDILMGRGYQPVDVNPQFDITEFITTRMGQETHTVPAAGVYPNAYTWPGSWYTWSSAWFPSWDTYVRDYVEGILLLDIVDANTKRLVWRAACKDKIDDMSERHKNIENAIKKALKSFPPKKR